MSTAGAGHTGTQGGGGVDWDSVLNLTMKDIRTKVPPLLCGLSSCRIPSHQDIYELRAIVCSDRYSDETREKVRRLIEHVEPPQQIP